MSPSVTKSEWRFTTVLGAFITIVTDCHNFYHVYFHGKKISQ